MLMPRKILFSLFLLIGVSLYAQQTAFVSSYVNKSSNHPAFLRLLDLFQIIRGRDAKLIFETLAEIS